MAYTYPKPCKPIPVSTVSYKVLVFLGLFFLSFACSGPQHNEAYHSDIEALEAELAQKTSCLEKGNHERFSQLKKRYERLFEAELPSGNEAIPEVLESARLFLQEYPEDFRMLQYRHDQILESLHRLEHTAGQQQYSEAEWAIALSRQQDQLERFYIDLAYVCDNFSAWHMNAETLEKALKLNAKP